MPILSPEVHAAAAAELEALEARRASLDAAYKEVCRELAFEAPSEHIDRLYLESERLRMLRDEAHEEITRRTGGRV